MRTVGIIAEYNPFHTGHAYHLEQARKLSGADHTVVVMSPDFVQRGEPAIFDKHLRARMALSCGADLVLELPVCYAAGSAEYFARGAVTLLDRLNCVDSLCFGCESGDTDTFRQAAGVLAEEPEAYRNVLQEQLRQGVSFPKAREAALKRVISAETQCKISKNTAADQAYGMDTGSCFADFLSGFFSSPNNILGLEYCKALRRLHSSITPCPVIRRGNGYHEERLSGEYCSATALRNALRSTVETSAESSAESSAVNIPSPGSQNREHTTLQDFPAQIARLLPYIPAQCQDLFLTASRTCMEPGDFLPILIYKLLETSDYSHILDISPDLSQRIGNLRYQCMGKSWAELTAFLKTKQITEARIRRCLLHLILNVTDSSLRSFLANGTVFYARVLGFRREAAPLLRQIKEKSTLPLLTKTAGASRQLNAYGTLMWEQNLLASHLYQSVRALKYGETGGIKTEYETGPVVM